MFKDTNVAEIYILTDKLIFFNLKGELVSLAFSSDITMNPFVRTLDLYLRDLKQVTGYARFSGFGFGQIETPNGNTN
ncbi:10889_t:CDS:2, partial [Scutellospora calospora]